MDTNKVATAAAAIGLVPSCYGGYVLWTSRHPGGLLTGSAGSPIALLALGAGGGLIVLAIVLWIANWWTRDAYSVVIHSAKYGTHFSNEKDVLAVVRKNQSKVLDLSVTNDRLDSTGPRDPTPGHLKRLRLEYSIGEGPRQVVEAEEGAHLLISSTSGHIVTPVSLRALDAILRQHSHLQ